MRSCTSSVFSTPFGHALSAWLAELDLQDVGELTFLIYYHLSSEVAVVFFLTFNHFCDLI